MSPDVMNLPTFFRFFVLPSLPIFLAPIMTPCPVSLAAAFVTVMKPALARSCEAFPVVVVVVDPEP